MKKKAGIIGCGWLGSKLAQHLIYKYTIFSTTTSPLKIHELNQSGFNPHILDLSEKPTLDKIQYEKTQKVFSETDIVIISVPFSKKEIVEKLENKLQNLLFFLQGYKGKIIFYSSIGIYPDCNKLITENNTDPKDYNKNIYLAENLLQEKFPEIVILRLGGLMGDSRVFSNFFLNKPVPNPDQRVNHVHYSDICGITEKIIDLDIRGKIYNITAPLHPKKAEFFNTPERIENFEMIKENSYNGKIVSSEKVRKELNYKFLFPDPLYFN